MLPLPIGLFAKTLITAGAIAGACYVGYVYKDEISHFFEGMVSKIKNLSPSTNRENTNLNLSLSLPSGCTLPGEGNTTCSNITPDQLKTINFCGKGDGTLSTEGTTNSSLSIEKLSGKESNYPHGFKFSLQNSDSTGITLKEGETTLFTLNNSSALPFGIKEEGGKWCLEKKSN